MSISNIFRKDSVPWFYEDGVCVVKNELQYHLLFLCIGFKMQMKDRQQILPFSLFPPQ